LALRLLLLGPVRIASTITADELLSYLGTSTVDHALRAFLARLGLTPKGPRLAGGFGDQPVPTLGVVLLFKAARLHPHIRASQALTAESKVLSDVGFTATGLAGGPPFCGALPYGLRFSDSRDATRARLGPPAWSNPLVNSDRWERDPRFVTVDFSADASSIKRVTVGLLSKP
jgi:hypothetical protein